MEHPGARLATTRELHHRARFHAVRARVFDEMGRSAARWRLTWILPFNILVVALMIARGESTARAAFQVVAVAMIGATFVARLFWHHPALKGTSFFCGVVSYFVLLATTGGLASPLLVMGTLTIVAAALTMPEPRWLRNAVFLTFLVGFVGLALLSQTALLEIPVSLRNAAWASPQYVCLALLATVFAMMGVHRISCTMSQGYERATLEVAERREELCTEGEDRSRALEGMAARLAHEVKNPLAAIKGLSTHMARNAADPKTAERLAIVAAEADRLQSIVDGFLSFSRGLDDLNIAPTKPYEVARELGVLLETRAEEAGVRIEVTGEEDLVLDADARKLRQALLNLVLNAIQASPHGSSVRVDVAASVCEGVRLTVRDDGVGMTSDVLDRIRKPYFTTKEGGTGLGVAVARGLVEQHGGRLELKSAPGRGTTVTVTLPTKAKPCARLPNPARVEKPAAASAR